MKRTLIGLLTATALTAAIPAVASAQTINERQNSLFTRIDAGMRSGQLTQGEANALRSDFYALARLEQDYRTSYPGLTESERVDLNRRFDALSTRIRFDRNDNDRYANWVPINQREENLFRQINQGVRRGGLTEVEANRLRAEFETIVALENTYRRNGLTMSERNDLDRRLDNLAQRIRMERRDGQQARNGWSGNIGQRVAVLSNAIERAFRNGWVNNYEARDLRMQHRELATLEARYRAGGYSPAERTELSRRIERLERNLEVDSGRDFGWNNGNDGWGAYYR
jgi:hypothetical protein